MNEVLKERVSNCKNCPEATHVISSNDSWYECKAIQGMGKRNKPNCHPGHQILVYGDKFFIPDICPMPITGKIGEIYSEEKEKIGKVRTLKLSK